MSEQIARQAITRMNLREQFIAPHYEGFASDIAILARAQPEGAREQFLQNQRMELCEAYGYSRREQSKPFAFADGVAIIPIHGTLLNRFGGSWGSVTGYNFIRSQHNAALLDPDVKVIVHDHNSFGGEAAGCFELADDIFESRATKPTLAVVDSNCYSASFALASAATKVIAIPSAGVGSVGVVAMHVNMSKMLKDWGIDVTFIHSGKHKVDGNPYEALSADVKADIQKGVDKSRARFVGVVARNLGLDEKVVYDTEARTYRADDALSLGLIHAIATPQKALQSFIDGDEQEKSSEGANTTTTTEEQTMSDQNAAAAAAPAAAAPAAAAAPVDASAVQKAERERVAGILSCEEAKGNPNLASHLALNTSMSLADAQGMLKAAGPAAPAPAAEAAPAAAAAPAANQFANAMAATPHPNVGADGGGGNGANDQAAQILADFSLASGVKFDTK